MITSGFQCRWEKPIRGFVKTGIFFWDLHSFCVFELFLFDKHSTLHVGNRAFRAQAMQLNSRLNYSHQNYSRLNPSFCVNKKSCTHKIGVKLWWTYCWPYHPLSPSTLLPQARLTPDVSLACTCTWAHTVPHCTWAHSLHVPTPGLSSCHILQPNVLRRPRVAECQTFYAEQILWDPSYFATLRRPAKPG